MRAFSFAFLFLLLITLSNCQNETQIPNIDVHWEHITNFTDKPDVFESKFTLIHKGGHALTDSNWALFFNIAPRPMRPVPEPQPATIKHLNGDWYQMIPNQDFKLRAGASIEIIYRGTEATVKESDRPLGLYFVYYDEAGNEKEIVEVANYTFSPFTKPEQMNRNDDDHDPIPSPEYLYRANQSLSKLPSSELEKVIPTPYSAKALSGSLTLDKEFVIIYDERTESEAQFLKDKLMQDVGLDLPMLMTIPGAKIIELKIDDVGLNGFSQEAYQLKINENHITISGSDESGVFYGIQSLRALLPITAFTKKRGAYPASEYGN